MIQKLFTKHVHSECVLHQQKIKLIGYWVNMKSLSVSMVVDWCVNKNKQKKIVRTYHLEANYFSSSMWYLVLDCQSPSIPNELEILFSLANVLPMWHEKFLLELIFQIHHAMVDFKKSKRWRRLHVKREKSKQKALN